MSLERGRRRRAAGGGRQRMCPLPPQFQHHRVRGARCCLANALRALRGPAVADVTCREARRGPCRRALAGHPPSLTACFAARSTHRDAMRPAAALQRPARAHAGRRGTCALHCRWTRVYVRRGRNCRLLFKTCRRPLGKASVLTTIASAPRRELGVTCRCWLLEARKEHASPPAEGVPPAQPGRWRLPPCLGRCLPSSHVNLAAAESTVAMMGVEGVKIASGTRQHKIRGQAEEAPEHASPARCAAARPDLSRW